MYVNRAFQSCNGAAETTRMEGLLKIMIEESAAAGDMHTRDWKTFPLPTYVMTRRPCYLCLAVAAAIKMLCLPRRCRLCLAVAIATSMLVCT